MTPARFLWGGQFRPQPAFSRLWLLKRRPQRGPQGKIGRPTSKLTHYPNAGPWPACIGVRRKGIRRPMRHRIETAPLKHRGATPDGGSDASG